MQTPEPPPACHATDVYAELAQAVSSTIGLTAFRAMTSKHPDRLFEAIKHLQAAFHILKYPEDTVQ